MTGNQTELKQLLDFAVRVAREAGDITYRYFKGSFAAERKADNSLVTVADREAERFIRESIERAFPEEWHPGRRRGRARGRLQAAVDYRSA